MKQLFCATALITLVSTPLVAQDASTVLAEVDGVKITLGHAIAMKERLPQQYQTLPDEVLFDALVEQLIQQEVMAAAVRETLSTKQKLSIENETRALLATDIITELQAQEVTEEQLQEAYDAEYANVEPEPEFNAAHILVETEEEAAALITQLEEGADFAELAKEHSTGPSGPNGGDLGWFGLGMMVAPFEEAVRGLEVGGVSAPVQTQFGWHVVKLNDSREKGAPELIEVRPSLEDRIRVGFVESYVEELMGKAEIIQTEEEIDPSLISQIELLEE